MGPHPPTIADERDEEAEALRGDVIADIVDEIKQFQYGDSLETMARFLFLMLQRNYGFEPRGRG